MKECTICNYKCGTMHYFRWHIHLEHRLSMAQYYYWFRKHPYVIKMLKEIKCKYR